MSTYTSNDGAAIAIASIDIQYQNWLSIQIKRGEISLEAKVTVAVAGVVTGSFELKLQKWEAGGGSQWASSVAPGHPYVSSEASSLAPC